MSGREFFTNRYRLLRWEFKPARLRQTIRINTINTQEADLEERLSRIGMNLERVPFLEKGYWITEAEFSAGATVEYLLGFYSIQEAAAQIPVTLFSQLQDRTVLDACAAPGGKTVQLADLMQNSGVIVALDVDKRRLNALANHLERCHVANTIAYLMDTRKIRGLNARFDGILLDVPCSGNFAIDKQWFSRRTIVDIERNAQLQREILSEAVNVLEDDGEIIYSTCSLEPEEDELNIDWAIRNLQLQTEPVECYGEKGLTNIFGKTLDPSVKNCRRIWPDQTQGFFVAKLRKRKQS
jgi:NOL1/NOP2/sun family putative RNA methylase